MLFPASYFRPGCVTTTTTAATVRMRARTARITTGPARNPNSLAKMQNVSQRSTLVTARMTAAMAVTNTTVVKILKHP